MAPSTPPDQINNIVTEFCEKEYAAIIKHTRRNPTRSLKLPIHMRLVGDRNYRIWTCRIRLLLRALGLEEHLDKEAAATFPLFSLAASQAREAVALNISIEDRFLVKNCNIALEVLALLKHKYSKAAAEIAGIGLALKHNLRGMAATPKLNPEAEELIELAGIANKGFPRTRTLAKNLEHMLDAFQTGGADNSKVLLVILEFKSRDLRRFEQ